MYCARRARRARLSNRVGDARWLLWVWIAALLNARGELLPVGLPEKPLVDPAADEHDHDLAARSERAEEFERGRPMVATSVGEPLQRDRDGRRHIARPEDQGGAAGEVLDVGPEIERRLASVELARCPQEVERRIGVLTTPNTHTEVGIQPAECVDAEVLEVCTELGSGPACRKIANSCDELSTEPILPRRTWGIKRAMELRRRPIGGAKRGDGVERDILADGKPRRHARTPPQPALTDGIATWDLESGL